MHINDWMQQYRFYEFVSFFSSFKNEHYHKQPLLKELKETKDCKDAFKNIQIPYKKAIDNLNKVKKVRLDWLFGSQLLQRINNNKHWEQFLIWE